MAATDGAPDEVKGVELAPEPLGAKQTDLDPRLTWRTQRARLGGYEERVPFTELHQEILNTAADLLIPPGGGFPAPSEVEILDFIARYVTPASREVKYFPLAAEYAFKDRLNALGQEFLDVLPSERNAKLKSLQESENEDEAAFFEQLRSLVYYGYYARPEVVAAIRKTLPAGRDYHGPPLPYGYDSVIEPWPEGILNYERGSYIATEAVTRIDIPDDLKQEYGIRS